MNSLIPLKNRLDQNLNEKEKDQLKDQLAAVLYSSNEDPKEV